MSRPAIFRSRMTGWTVIAACAATENRLISIANVAKTEHVDLNMSTPDKALPEMRHKYCNRRRIDGASLDLPILRFPSAPVETSSCTRITRKDNHIHFNSHPTK